MKDKKNSLGRLGGVLDKLDTLFNVPLEPLVASLQQLLLVLARAADNVVRLLGAFCAQLDGDREVVAAGFLCDGVAAFDAGEVDVGGFDDTGFALHGFHDFFGEAIFHVRWFEMMPADYGECSPVSGISHGEGGGSGTVLCFDDFVTTELDAWCFA